MSHAPAHPFLSGAPKKLLIGGEWVDAASGEVFDVFNPSTGEVIAQVARAGAADVDRAVRAARAAFEGAWAGWSPLDRQALMLRIADRVEGAFDELALLETLDMGAPIARTSLFKRWLLQAFRYYAAQAVNIRGDTLENSVPGSLLSFTTKGPIGVVGGIIPWNGPLITQLWSICPTLATGCTLVLKPAEEAPLSTLRLGEIMMEAGLPAGVVNIVPGPGATAGAALAGHPDVDKIAFTGSTATGRSIVEASAVNMKRVAVELGGKSPDIIFADADLDKAVPGAGMACFNNSGQICYAGSRILVHRRIHDEFAERLAAFSRTLRVGDAMDQHTQIGPLTSRAQLDRVTRYIGIGTDEGAQVVAGGGFPDGAPEQGYFLQPTLLAGVRNDMRVAQEEIFGPIASLIPFDDDEQAIAIANNTQYGLAGAAWTRDIGRGLRTAQAIRAGMVWINCYGVTDPSVGYAGTRMSGYGMKGGPHHLDEYLNTKTVWIDRT